MVCSEKFSFTSSHLPLLIYLYRKQLFDSHFHFLVLRLQPFEVLALFEVRIRMDLLTVNRQMLNTDHPKPIAQHNDLGKQTAKPLYVPKPEGVDRADIGGTV